MPRATSRVGRRRSSPTSNGSGSPGTRGRCGRASARSGIARRRRALGDRFDGHHAPARGRLADLPARHPSSTTSTSGSRTSSAATTTARTRPVHRRLFEALGATPPEFVHHGLILGADGRKLSKRAGGATVASCASDGFPAEAVRAYLEELGLPQPRRPPRPAAAAAALDRGARGAGDEELAARVGVPVSVAPVLRGARDLVEAREYATLVLEPQRGGGRRARRRSSASASSSRRASSRGSDRAGAEGGRRRPEGAAPRADGRGARPRARCGDRGAPAATSCCVGRRLERCALYNTLSRQLEELPPPPGPIRHVLLRPDRLPASHIGNARPVRRSGCGCARWLRAARLRRDARPQHHRHQRQDLRRRARARAPSSPSDATALVPRGHRRPRPRHARRRCRRRPRRVPQIVALIEQLVAARLRVRGRGRRLLPRRAATRTTGGCRGSGPTRSRSRSRTRSRRIRATSRSGRRTSRARTRAWDSPWGTRPARLAHRVLGDGGGAARARASRSTAAGSTSSSRTTRTSSRSRARSGTSSRGSGCTTGCSTLRRREDVEVARQRRHAPRRARHVGPRDAPALLHDRPLAQAARLRPTRRSSRRARSSRRFRNVFRSPSEPVGDWARLRGGARRRLQHARGARGPARLARPRAAAARVRDLRARARSPSSEEAPAELVALAEQRARRAGGEGLRRGRPPARRDRSRRAGRCATSPAASSSSRRA